MIIAMQVRRGAKATLRRAVSDEYASVLFRINSSSRIRAKLPLEIWIVDEGDTGRVRSVRGQQFMRASGGVPSLRRVVDVHVHVAGIQREIAS